MPLTWRWALLDDDFTLLSTRLPPVAQAQLPPWFGDTDTGAAIQLSEAVSPEPGGDTARQTMFSTHVCSPAACHRCQFRNCSSFRQGLLEHSRLGFVRSLVILFEAPDLRFFHITPSTVLETLDQNLSYLPRGFTGHIVIATNDNLINTLWSRLVKHPNITFTQLSPNLINMEVGALKQILPASAYSRRLDPPLDPSHLIALTYDGRSMTWTYKIDAESHTYVDHELTGEIREETNIQKNTASSPSLRTTETAATQAPRHSPDHSLSKHLSKSLSKSLSKPSCKPLSKSLSRPFSKRFSKRSSKLNEEPLTTEDPSFPVDQTNNPPSPPVESISSFFSFRSSPNASPVVSNQPSLPSCSPDVSSTISAQNRSSSIKTNSAKKSTSRKPSRSLIDPPTGTLSTQPITSQPTSTQPISQPAVEQVILEDHQNQNRDQNLDQDQEPLLLRSRDLSGLIASEDKPAARRPQTGGEYGLVSVVCASGVREEEFFSSPPTTEREKTKIPRRRCRGLCCGLRKTCRNNYSPSRT